MIIDELEGEHWLLSYEANRKGWLPSVGGGDHVASHPIFRLMKMANVSFYNQFSHPLTKPLTLKPPDPKTGSP